MSKFIVTARSARIHSGVLLLTVDQAKPRALQLKPLGKNRYEITGSVEFKSGEEIGYEGDLPKALAENLTSKADAEKAAAKAAKEKEAADKLSAAENKKENQLAAEQAQKQAAEEHKQREADANAAWQDNAELRDEYKGDKAAYLSNALSAG